MEKGKEKREKGKWEGEAKIKRIERHEESGKEKRKGEVKTSKK